MSMASISCGLGPNGSDIEARRRRGLFLVGAAVALALFALSIQVGLNANFLVEEIGVTGTRMGLVEVVRESCGIVAFGVLALLAGLTEPLVGAAMLVLMAVGMGSYAFVPSYGWVLIASVIWSQGFHVWMPLPSSMTLALAEPERTGYRLGQMGAAGSIGFGAGILVALGLTMGGVPMRPLYFVAAAAAILAAVVCLAIPRNLKTPGPRLVFRRRYGLYYVLCLLDGWRRQIFICFVGLLLVKDHGTPIKGMLLLGAVVQALNCVVSPRVGRLIDRIGERRSLVIYFVCVTAAFFGYAFIGHVWLLYALVVVDNLCWSLATALTTYVNRITPPSERTPTLSMGVAMNHVGAVTMPLFAGLLWDSVSHRAPFFVGAVAAAASIFVALRVPRHGALPGAAEERATTDRTESTDQAKRRPG